MANLGEESEDDIVLEVYKFAAASLRENKSPQTVEAELLGMGLDPEAVAVVVTSTIEILTEAQKNAGIRNMAFGALWFLGGTAVTAGTYIAASGGGFYVVTFGAILFGGIQFFRGLGQFVSAGH